MVPPRQRSINMPPDPPWSWREMVKQILAMLKDEKFQETLIERLTLGERKVVAALLRQLLDKLEPPENP